MKIEVKNLKIAQFASEETLCYEATVYVDGKKAFFASNQGRGGPDFYRPIDKALMNAAMEYVKTLPAIKTEWGSTLDMNMELFIGELLDEKQLEKEVKKILKKTAYLIGTELWTMKNPYDERIKAYIMKKHPDAIILNELPAQKVMELVKGKI